MKGIFWAWAFFLLYLLVTLWFAWQGKKRTATKADYAVGDRSMSPWIAGVTLGSCMVSSATFVLFPGYVYADGLAALLGLGVAHLAGVSTGLFVFAPRFQALDGDKAVSVPHWLGMRYQSSTLRRLFSALNILLLAYTVLVTVSCGIVVSKTLGISYQAAIVAVVCIVFGYSAIGGAWAHAFTNSLQGLLMLVIASMVFASGWSWWMDGSVMRFLQQSPSVSPNSPLFSSSIEVWLVSYCMGLAFATQPQVLTKALYVRNQRELRKTLCIGIGCHVVFSLILFAGIYAHLALPQAVSDQKLVMAQYLQIAFDWKLLGVFASVGIVAASMSTLDGLLVAISASVVLDLLPERVSVRANWLFLALLGLLTLAISWNPPRLGVCLRNQRTLRYLCRSDRAATRRHVHAWNPPPSMGHRQRHHRPLSPFWSPRPRYKKPRGICMLRALRSCPHRLPRCTLEKSTHKKRTS